MVEPRRWCWSLRATEATTILRCIVHEVHVFFVFRNTTQPTQEKVSNWRVIIREMGKVQDIFQLSFFQPSKKATDSTLDSVGFHYQ